jgi:ubiquinone/menaquinone biosynthesis C-methylase UbiE
MELQMLAAGEYSWTSEADPIRYYRLPIVGRLFQRRVSRCVALLPPGKRVVELGYGSGVSFLNLGQRFEEIHGIDLHDHADDVARSFSSTTLTLRLRQGSIAKLPYEDGSFDAALAISIHEEIPLDQQETAFAEVHRVLRPGGCYVVGVPGVNFLMNAALYLLGCNIRKYHVSTDAQVLAAMSRRFNVDTIQFLPAFWPKSLTTYVCIRGWK